MTAPATTHVVVHLEREEDARCVADALVTAGNTVAPAPCGWDVNVAGSSLDTILAALQQCLAENEIPLVRVTVDGHTYAMEAPPPQA